ncbi:MAG: hypothetical protein IPO36_03385 [Anaerolineales bacterium]|nr:hypothetical protein [Anaerolineales bacterium]
MAHEDEFPILVAQEGPLKGQRWSLSHGLMVGRDPTCDINVQDRPGLALSCTHHTYYRRCDC